MSEFDDLVSSIKGLLIYQLSRERFIHSIGVQGVAERLAKRWGVDPKKASICSLLHDCGRGLRSEDARLFVRAHRIDLDRIEESIFPIWHGKIGEKIATLYYNICDPQILQAIRYHPTADTQMPALSKILWIADYVEPGRPFKQKDEIFSLAMNDLDSGLLVVLKAKVSFLEKMGRPIHPRSLEAIRLLEKKIEGVSNK